MTPDAKKILVTGSTGFIGGSVLSNLLDAPESSLELVEITCLLRGADRAEILSSSYGDRVKPVVYRDLDDIEATVAIAAEHDVVINTTAGYHSASATALVRGLAQRKASTGRDVWMIHTSGISNVGNKPITQPDAPVLELDDVRDDVYAHEKSLEALELYPQRTTELAVVDTGLELGVKTVVIMSPIVYGNGSGLFNKTSAQTSSIKAMLLRNKAAVVGDGKAEWDRVHIADLADLYRLVLLEILDRQGAALPTGKKGIIFGANGRHSWLSYAQGVASVGYKEGLLQEDTVDHLSLEEAARTLIPNMVGTDLDEKTRLQFAEVFASDARTVASVARTLGWAPSKGEESWQQAISHDVKQIAASLKK